MIFGWLIIIDIQTNWWSSYIVKQRDRHFYSADVIDNTTAPYNKNIWLMINIFFFTSQKKSLHK